MKQKFRIHVTQADIDKGCEGSSRSCPIAHAINRQLPNYYRSNVSMDGITILNEDCKTIFSAKPPFKARDFIDSFDESAPVEPFIFTITNSLQK